MAGSTRWMASSADRVLKDIFAEMFEVLGSTMAGFTEVTVVSPEQMGLCTRCGCPVTIGAEMLQIIRQWCFNVNTQCKSCHKIKGVNKNVIEACIGDENGQVLARAFKVSGHDS